MQLLVSPSTIDEAKHSVAADIIDVKKPSEGSLGANFPWVIREIKTLSAKPVSAAIGDFNYKPGGAALAAYGAACAGADFVKIGLAFDGKEQAREVISAVVKAVKDEFPEKYVVIAAYSDYQRMHSISPIEMAPIAAECGADFAMVDTGIKDRQSTFAFMNEGMLRTFTDNNRNLDSVRPWPEHLNLKILMPSKGLIRILSVCGGWSVAATGMQRSVKTS